VGGGAADGCDEGLAGDGGPGGAVRGGDRDAGEVGGEVGGEAVDGATGVAGDEDEGLLVPAWIGLEKVGEGFGVDVPAVDEEGTAVGAAVGEDDVVPGYRWEPACHIEVGAVPRADRDPARGHPTAGLGGFSAPP